MFFEYALEPEVLSTWENVRYFLDALGASKGRLVAEYPRRWRRMVYEGLQCSDFQKKRIEIRLAALGRGFFSGRSGASFDAGRTWIENALAEHQRSPFTAIVAMKGEPENGVLEASDLDGEHPLWKVEHDRLLARRPEAFASAFSLLLRASKRVILIDPYFRPYHSSKLRMLVALCAALSSGQRFEVHTGLGGDKDPTFGCFADECRKRLPREIPGDISVAVHVWRQRRGGPRLHNRYLITDVGGVKFGDSVEVGKEGENDLVSLLTETSRVEIWREYVDPAESFDRMGEPISLVGKAAMGRCRSDR